MNRLSSGRLFNIFSWMDDQTLHNCKLVCKKWNHLIKEYGFFEVHMPDINSINELSRIRIRWLWLSPDRERIGNRDFPTPRYPDSVRFLRLTGSISLQNWNIVVQGFVNLRHLELGWLNLEIVGSESGAWCHFPELRILKLCGPDFDAISDDEGSLDTRKLNNHAGLIGALQKFKFPKLRTLDIEGLLFEWSNNMFVDALLSILSSHQETLENVCIALNLDISLQLCRDDFEAHSDEDWLKVPDFEARLSKLDLDLDSFFFHFDPLARSENLSRLVDRITTNQPNLCSSVVLWPHFPAFNNRFITHDNCRELTTLAFSIYLEQPLDCSMLENCSSLTKLMINAQPKTREEYDTENYRGQPAQSQLVNIHRLPKSLDIIEIVNFFIETTELTNFTSDQQFPDLAVLNLQGIGEKENLGFTLEMLAILAWKRLQEVGIYRGFNRRNLEESCNSSNGAVAFMALGLLQEVAVYNGGIETLSVYYSINDDDDLCTQDIGNCQRQILRTEFAHKKRVMFTADPKCGDFFRTFKA